jgi:membrane protein DedA with SNARE-associated domain
VSGLVLWLLLWSYGPLVAVARFDSHACTVMAIQAVLVALTAVFGFFVAWWIRGDKRRAA